LVKNLVAARSSYARKLLCDVKGFRGGVLVHAEVKDGSGRINPVARLRRFRVDAPMPTHEAARTRRTGQADQDLVELVGDVVLQAVANLTAAQPLGGASDEVAAGPPVES